jgi:hypothetical protein
VLRELALGRSFAAQILELTLERLYREQQAVAAGGDLDPYVPAFG